MDPTKTERFIKSVESAMEGAELGEWTTVAFHHAFCDIPSEDLLISLAGDNIRITSISTTGFTFKIEDPSIFKRLPIERIEDLFWYLVYQKGYELLKEFEGGLSLATDSR